MRRLKRPRSLSTRPLTFITCNPSESFSKREPRPDRRGASFETPASRAPQDEACFSMPSNAFPHAEECPKGASRSTHLSPAALHLNPLLSGCLGSPGFGPAVGGHQLGPAAVKPAVVAFAVAVVAG